MGADMEPQGKQGDGQRNDAPLLQVKDLKTYFFTRTGTVKAVDGVSLTIRRGEVRGIVGESGCGKSMTAMSILQLVDKPGRIVSGEVSFKGENLLAKSRREMTAVRGKQIAVIFQEPKSSLNPVLRVGDQLIEVLRVHEDAGRPAQESEAVSMLKEVGIPDPKQRVSNYPHEMSGGMAQRVMIAMGMACAPDLLIAPYLLFGNYFLDLAIVLVSAVLIIAAFNYYISVAKNEPFRERFLEMAGISLGVAAFSFLIGFLIREFLGLDI